MGAHYHGLQASLSGNIRKGLFIKSAYTYSKAINMTDDDGWVSVNWNWQPTIDRNVAPAGYDRTQVFQNGFPSRKNMVLKQLSSGFDPATPTSHLARKPAKEPSA